MRKLKCLLVHPAIRNYREPLYSKLSEVGYEFLFTMINPINSPSRQDVENILKDFRGRWTQCREWKSVGGLNNFSLDLRLVFNYDIIIFTSLTSVPFLLCALPLKLLGKKLLLFDETWKYQYQVRRYQVLLPYVRFLVKNCVRAIIAGSSLTASMFIRDFGIASQKIFIACNTTADLHETDLSSARAIEIKAMIDGFAEQRVVVLSLCRFVEIKAIDILVRSFTSVSERACLILVGEGEQCNQLETLIVELKLTERVKILPAADPQEVAYYYGSADISTLVSRFMPDLPVNCESWGFTVNEAMSMEVPVVVSTAVGAHLDLIIDGVTGMLVDQNDTTSLSEKLNILIEDPELRLSIGKRGREHLMQTCSYEQNFHAFQKAVSYAINQ